MKRIILLILCAFASVGLNAQDTLRLMSYNLRFGELASMKELGEYIASKNPDIVALQECDWATMRERAPRQNGVKFINELASVTGMFGVYGKTIDYKGGYYGIGLLSRYPIVKMERVLLPRRGNDEQRCMLLNEILLPDGHTVTFICTHLEVSSAAARAEQLKFINKRVEGIQGPVFIAGDMNATPDSPEIKNGFAKWQHLTNNEYTFSSTKPTIKIDYICSRTSKPIVLLDTEVCADAHLSDHFPVFSKIILNY